ncbi:MAG TPA: peptidylprolyl isomerase, partial [Gemmataceae bacterium]|nr:peptidylprolyl isomerase [Gemmataceae bacterium]
IDHFRRQQERTFIAQEYIRSRIQPWVQQVCPAMIKEWYDQHPNEFRTLDKVKWQDIFIATPNHGSAAAARRVAEEIVERVKRGDTFDNYLKLDEGDSWKWRQGNGNGEQRHEISPPELMPYLFAMKDGQVGPLVELSTGYHVFRLLKREVAGQKPLDDKLQTTIAAKLKNEIAEREYKRIIKELKERAVIVIEPGSPGGDKATPVSR